LLGRESDRETVRLARLDTLWNPQDRLLARGFEHKPAAPGHDDILARARQTKCLVQRTNILEAPIESLALAKSLIRTCREFGVGLRLETDGTLVVESNGRAWRSLVQAIEIHDDGVAQLIEAKWDSNDA
jgi:hypothetical protein